MSTYSMNAKAASVSELREQIAETFASHTTSAQATGDFGNGRHNDGENIYKDFSLPPLHRYLHKAEKHGKAVATHPGSFVNAVTHVTGRDLDYLGYVADDVEYRPEDPDPHPAFEDEPRLRGKLLEWLAADDRRWGSLSDSGTDLQMHGEPGSGKSTFGQFLATILTQANNETVLWADTMDESGVSERTEWLSLAPWITVALPDGLPVEVRVTPTDPSLSPFTIDLTDLVRDVVRYKSPRDLNKKLTPGQIYVVYPDPLFRGCNEVSRFDYHAPGDVTPDGEDGPNSSTPVNQWWFAYMAARITHNDFVHFTSLLLDEAGNLLDPDAEKDDHQSYQKVKWFAEKFADARKNGVTVVTMTHALSELHPKYRKKQRWWATLAGNSPPVGKKLPGEKRCPLETDLTSRMPTGQGVVWSTNKFAPIAWPNMKSRRRVDAKFELVFPTVSRNSVHLSSESEVSA
ncbi:hypothetical protein [Halocalculus aciditolerans]|nr:hypothetical protein [Halocalculus aciditolerans]